MRTCRPRTASIRRRPVTTAAVRLLVVVTAFFGYYGLAEQPAVGAVDPVLAAVGDVACDPANSGYNGGSGDAADCQQKATAALLSATGRIGPVDAVLPLGDEQYNCGGLTAFNQVYKPTWGTQDGISHPVPGNHEYQNSGGTGCPVSHDASGYFTYFGSPAGDPSKGYYSFNLGAWHIIALNSELCYGQAPYNQSPITPGCQAGSPEETWLKADLAANTTACTLAYWHEPRWYSYGGGSDSTFDPWWKDLYAAHADLVLNGHQHFYERFALQNPSGQADANGLREFVVGTGGESLMPLSSPRRANSQASASTFGVLKLALHSASYDWNFVPITGTYTDSGTTSCHGTPPADTTPPTTAMSCNAGACINGWYDAPVSVSLAATDAGSGVASTRYTTDGSNPATSSTAKMYAGPFTLSSSATVSYYSTDKAGNAEPTQSRQLAIDTAAPVTTFACNLGPCGNTYSDPVSLTLAATDTGGSGLATTRYTTDGSDPATSTSGIVYSGPFSVAHSTTIRYASTDVAGNQEATKSQTVSIASAQGDTTPPTTAIACDNAPCSGGWFGPTPPTVTLTANDSGGSGVAGTTYTTDGTDPRTSSTAKSYTGLFTAPSTETVRYFSTDNAGNVEATQSQLVQVDTTPPSTTIGCNGAGCSSWNTTSPVTVTLSASDGGQSGVAVTSYTTDGTDPTSSSTAVNYTGPFTVTATTTVRYSSRDGVGDVEQPKSAAVRIDTTAPTTVVYCGTAGDPCGSSPYSGSVAVSLLASDAGGSGVARTVYTTDGSDPKASATALTYSTPFDVSATTTLRAFSADVAGNAEATVTQVIQVSAGGTSGSATFAPTDDTYTSQSNPGATHGSERSLNVNSGSASTRWSWLMFKVDVLPAGATGVVAGLQLYSQSSAGSAVTFSVRKVATTWREATLTWNNQPALGSLVSTRTGLTTGAYNTFDLSALIGSNGTYAVAITTSDQTQRYLNSKEAAANRPRLLITWKS